MTFIHLRVRTSYSLLESALSIPRIAKLAAADMMPAVGIADTDNLFGALEASDKLAAAGVQPIIGTVLAIEGIGRVPLLARNDRGYANLCALSSEAHLRPAGGSGPSVAMQVAAQHSDGLLALSGGPHGGIDEQILAGNLEEAHKRLLWLADTYGNGLYVELQRAATTWNYTEPYLREMARELRLPIVGTHECLFAGPGDYEAHDTLLAIAAKKRTWQDDRPQARPEQWFMPQADMKSLFADAPEAIANTVEIAKRCHARPRGRKPILPTFSANEREDLRTQARAGLAERLAIESHAPLSEYQKRLEYECGVIAKMGFAGYFLIVSDFIRWAKANGIPVGPGRGSGAGSVVAWSLHITDLDPLRFGLLFERFLNPDRVSMPDFDVDFCQERREEVIRYVQQRYGADRVAQIITHGKLQAKAVIRDVGRAMGVPFYVVERLAKLIPNNPAQQPTIEEAMEMEPQLALARSDESVDRLITTALKLEGLYRHASTHAAGMVIGDRPLHELVPLYRDPKTDFPITQFNWKVVEQAGLVKFDFLGLKTLTVIRKTLEHVKRDRGITVDMGMVPLDDAATMDLFAAADTVGVFQLESTGMRAALRQMKPDRFEDIIAMVALYRPGPMENIPLYVNRKHGEVPIEYPHEMLEPILRETYGVIIYQEQVIQIAQVLAGYSLGQADLLRRAMGKKDKDEMAKQRAGFVSGSVRNGVDEQLAGEIFDLVDKFAGYGFNKSHAAAYALIAYHTAFLKAHYREEFLAASMTLDMADTDKLAIFSREARASGISITTPNVQVGGVEFMPLYGDGRVVYAMSGLKGVGASTARAIADEALKRRFASLTDFFRRMPPKSINKRSIEALAAAGAFDELEPARERIHASAADILAYAKIEAEDARLGTLDLFGGSKHGARKLELCSVDDWAIGERAAEEYRVIGSYLSCHPLDGHRAALKRKKAIDRLNLEALARKIGRTGAFVGATLIDARRAISKKSGNPYYWLTLSDRHGVYDAIAWTSVVEENKDIMVPGSCMLARLDVESSEGSVRYLVGDVREI